MSEPTVDLDFRLDGRVALVTGGGIGHRRRDRRRPRAPRGPAVAVVDLNESGAVDACRRPSATTAAASAATWPTPNRSPPPSTRSPAALDRIDILVNSAGVVMLAPAEELSIKAWDTTIDVNLKGTFLMCQTVGNRMLAAGRGAIINMASQAATVALDQHVAYCASKFGVVGLSKVLAAEWAGRGVRVNTISPTVVLTELGHKAWDGPRGDALKKRIPTGRFAYPNEIAAAAVFLASDAAGNDQRRRPAHRRWLHHKITINANAKCHRRGPLAHSRAHRSISHRKDQLETDVHCHGVRTRRRSRSCRRSQRSPGSPCVDGQYVPEWPTQGATRR